MFVQINRMYDTNSESVPKLWTLGDLICQCRLISCNKCITLVGEVNNGEGYAHVGAGSIWKISVPSFQFCYEVKTSLK